MVGNIIDSAAGHNVAGGLITARTEVDWAQVRPVVENIPNVGYRMIDRPG